MGVVVSRRPDGIGNERLIVRGQRFLDLSLARGLRVKYDEYPERYPLDPRFPQPGRRGPSPVKAVQNAPAAGGAGGGEVGAGVSPVVAPVVDVYPLPRARPGADLSFDAGGSPLVELGQPGAGVNCCPTPEGIHIQFATAILTGVTDLRSTVALARPFVIKYVEFFSDTTEVSASRGTLRVDSSGDVSAGAVNQGAQLDEGAIGLADFGLLAGRSYSFPDKHVHAVPRFLKFATVNGSAGTVIVQWIVNIEWLQ
jgi:hypothetical protein